MRFSTDDGLFGFIVTPLTGSGMYRFQLVIHGELVGDTQPSFLESTMGSIGRLHQLDNSRLGRSAVDAASVKAIIDSDDVLHDAALLQMPESLDGWSVRGYVYEGDAILLAQKYSFETGDPIGPILVSTVPLAEYCSVFGAAYDYWTKTRHGKKRWLGFRIFETTSHLALLPLSAHEESEREAHTEAVERDCKQLQAAALAALGG